MSEHALPPDAAAVIRHQRLCALASYGAIEAGPSGALDSLVQLAARLCDAPTGLITLVDEARQVFQARVGFSGPADAPLEVGFCPLVVERGTPVVIPDALADPVHAENAAVRGGVRFYAGVPLLADGRHVLGTLCVLDAVPRPDGLTPAQLEMLQTLAVQVISQFELRRSLAQRDALLAEQQATLRERDALVRAQAAIAVADGNLDAILPAVVAHALDALPAADRGVPELIDGDALEHRAVGGTLAPHRGLRVPLCGSLAGSCAAANRPVVVDDARNDRRVVRTLIETLHLRSAVLVPVARGDQVLGVLKLQSSRPNGFGQRDLQVVQLFAAAAAAGLTEVRAADARKAMLAGAQRQQAIFDSAVDFAIIATGRDGRVTDWNAGAERILGWTVDEMRGEAVERIFTPEDRAADRAGEEMRLVLEHARALDERWHLRRDGSRFWASGAMVPLRDGQDANAGFLKMLRDRTAEHQAGEALREAEARLRESEDHFRHTVELNPQVPWTCDPQGSITSYSTRWLDLTGQAPGEPDGAGWIKALHPDDVEPTTTLFSACLASGEPVDTAYRIRIAATGEYRWMRARAYPRRDADGRIIRWHGIVEDVHDRKLAEDRLRASEERFRAFAQAVPNHIWTATPDGLVDWVNERSLSYAGTGPGDSLGEGWAVRVHPDDRAVVQQRWVAALASGEPYEAEFRLRRGDGAYRWHLSRAVPFRGADGTVLRWIGTNTDVEEQKATAEALARANETLEVRVTERTRERDRVWNSTNDLMGTAGLDGYLRRVNPAWSRMLGWSEVELLAQPFAALLDPADQLRTAEAVRRLAAGESVTDLVSDLRQDDGGRRTILWDAVPDGTVFHIVGRDLTAQRRAEEQLRQSQKMEAVGHLTGGLAHDFNNLLTGIAGSLELLGTRIAQGRLAGLDRYVTTAQGAARRAAALTHRLLAFSRRQTLDPKPTNVNRLVAGMEELIRRTVGPAIEVEVLGAADLWPTLVDPPQLENALLNLCINARDAMTQPSPGGSAGEAGARPGGGRLTIGTANRRLDGRAAQERDLLPGQYVSLCVGDTGTGMTPEVIAKAFDPFFTTKPLGQGTGLGLSMIYGFARQSGGQARIDSEPGRGTTVCLYLPRHLGEVEAGEAPAVPAELARAGRDETVLVVDDEPTVRMLVTEVLEDLGYAAIEAADGASGLRVLQSDVRVDLLVTDVGLPGGMNGRQVADAARVARPELKVLFITGYAETAILGSEHLEPGMHVMTKPFAMEAFAGRIRELIAGR